MTIKRLFDRLTAAVKMGQAVASDLLSRDGCAQRRWCFEFDKFQKLISKLPAELPFVKIPCNVFG